MENFGKTKKNCEKLLVNKQSWGKLEETYRKRLNKQCWGNCRKPKDMRQLIDMTKNLSEHWRKSGEKLCKAGNLGKTENQETLGNTDEQEKLG